MVSDLIKQAVLQLRLIWWSVVMIQCCCYREGTPNPACTIAVDSEHSHSNDQTSYIAGETEEYQCPNCNQLMHYRSQVMRQQGDFSVRTVASNILTFTIHLQSTTEKVDCVQ